MKVELNNKKIYMYIYYKNIHSIGNKYNLIIN